MSKPVNPAIIGGFSLGAVALLVVALLIFGVGEDLKADKIQYVVFFDSSLNGLDIGAPVKLQGVKVGQVKAIALQLDRKLGKIYKPVVLEIDRSSITGTSGAPLPDPNNLEQLRENRDRLVALGMRARLETQSLLTGLLYVDLNFYPDRPPYFAHLEYKGLLEIPGLPTTADELKNTAEEVARKLRAMPLDQIVQDLADSLREVKELLKSEDVEKSRVALTNTLVELDKSAKILNNNLEPLLRHSDLTIQNANNLVVETRNMISELKQSVPGLFERSDQTLIAATAALKQADSALQQVDHALGPGSSLTDTLDAVKQAARAVRDLSDYLERHPESLLHGKN